MFANVSHFVSKKNVLISQFTGKISTSFVKGYYKYTGRLANDDIILESRTLNIVLYCRKKWLCCALITKLQNNYLYYVNRNDLFIANYILRIVCFTESCLLFCSDKSFYVFCWWNVSNEEQIFDLPVHITLKNVTNARLVKQSPNLQ